MGSSNIIQRITRRAKATEGLARDILTTGQVARLFGVNFKTVLRWAQTGQLPSSRLPGRRGDYRFQRTQVLEFAQQNQYTLSIPAREEKTLILVVDDDPLIARSIERLFHGLFNVISASDGYQAGVLMGLKIPTMVFLDLQMPGVDGNSLLRYMRSVDEFREIPVCVVSGASPEKMNDAIAAGATAVLEKPFNADQIRAIAARLIHSTQERRAA